MMLGGVHCICVLAKWYETATGIVSKTITGEFTVEPLELNNLTFRPFIGDLLL